MLCSCLESHFLQLPRCVQLVWSSDYENPAAWADLIGKVKDGVLSAFDNAISQREDEVRRSESQRQMPGWNFCTYFILKVLEDNNISRSFTLTISTTRKALHHRLKA